MSFITVSGSEVFQPYYNTVLNNLSELKKKDPKAYRFICKKTDGESVPISPPSHALLKRMNFIKPDGEIYSTVKKIISHLKQNKSAEPVPQKPPPIYPNLVILPDGCVITAGCYNEIVGKFRDLKQTNPHLLGQLGNAIYYDSPVYNPLLFQLGLIDFYGALFFEVKSVYLSLYSRHHAKALQTIAAPKVSQTVS